MRLQDKVILVTGGASGIGLAAVEQCLKEGASVVLADLARSEGEIRAEAFSRQYPNRCLFLPVDVTSTKDVDQLVERTVVELGRLDGVFNNAGVGGMSPADEYPDEDFLRNIDINLNGVFRIARAALRQMYRQGSGCIVNSASILSICGQTNTVAYTAAKGAVINMTRTLALEGAAKGVRVNAISPGYVDTPLLKDMDPEMKQSLMDLHPMGRLGKPEEIAKALVFLLSDDASFVTGANLFVDGGFTAGKS